MKRVGKKSSTTYYVIKALIPYTDENLKLIFMPAEFFKKLKEQSDFNERSLQNSFYKLMKEGSVQLEDGRPLLTEKGVELLELYEPELLKNASLMVVFDIPESERNKRYMLRSLLKQLRFVQIQKSVWLTKYECRKYLAAEIDDLDLSDYVQIYESRRLL